MKEQKIEAMLPSALAEGLILFGMALNIMRPATTETQRRIKLRTPESWISRTRSAGVFAPDAQTSKNVS